MPWQKPQHLLTAEVNFKRCSIYNIRDKMDKLKLEEFLEFLRGYTDLFNKNKTCNKR